MAKYQKLFEDLKSQVMLSLPYLPESYYISIFTGGLKEEIKSMYKIVRQTFVSQAFEIAFLQENAIIALNKNIKIPNQAPL